MPNDEQNTSAPSGLSNMKFSASQVILLFALAIPIVTAFSAGMAYLTVTALNEKSFQAPSVSIAKDSVLDAVDDRMVPTEMIIAKIASRSHSLEKTPEVVLKSVAAIQSRRDLQSAHSQAPAQQVKAQTQQKPTSANDIPLIGYGPDGSSLSTSDRAIQIKQVLSSIPEDFTVNWLAEDEKLKLYVFTDPTCPFCKRLHDAMGELNAAGISVHYFLYPRDLPNSTETRLSPTGQLVSNVWCSADQKSAFDEAFMGYKVRDASCADLPEDMARIQPPLADHFFLGTLFDVQGTPTMATNTGLRLEGFTSASKLIEQAFATP